MVALDLLIWVAMEFYHSLTPTTLSSLELGWLSPSLFNSSIDECVCRALIEAGADINHQDFDGWTPLHGAAHWGQEDSCKVLVEALCDMDLRDKHGKTAAEQADESLVKLMAELYEKQKSVSEFSVLMYC